MKSIVRHAVVATLGLAAWITVQQASAQTQLAGWNVYGQVNGGGTPPAPLAASFFDTNYVTAGNLTKGTNPGVGSITTGNVYGGSDFYTTNESEANAISNGFFVSYSCVASPGYLISIGTNFLSYHNSATGPTNGALQYCTDGVSYSNIFVFTYAPYDMAETLTTNINLSTNVFLQNVPAGTTNFFRLVNWGTFSNGTSGTWYVEGSITNTNSGLQIIGSVEQELAGWSTAGTVNGGGSPPAPLAAAVVADNVTAGEMTKGSTPGPANVTTANVYGGNDWYMTTENEANSISGGLYIAFSAYTDPGFTMSISDLMMTYHNSATGPTNGYLQYCTDGVSYSNIYFISYAPYDTAETITTNLNLATNAFLQNIPVGTTNYFRIVNWGTVGTGTAGTWYIEAPAGLQLVGNLNSFGIVAPTNLVVSPSSGAANAGTPFTFSVSAEGSPPTYSWYSGNTSAGTLLPTATNSTLTFSSVAGSNAGSYFVVLSNSSGVATSGVVTLSVVDPYIVYGPNSVSGFLGGVAQFTTTAIGVSPSYAWYQSSNGTSYTLIANGAQPSGSRVSGQGTTSLTISGLQLADATNFADIEVVVSDSYGTNTSAPASLLYVSGSGATLASYNLSGVNNSVGFQDGLPNSGIIAQWDFNGTNFLNPQLNPPPYTDVFNPAAPCVLYPQPWIGVGTCTAIGCVFSPGTSPFNGALAAGEDGNGFTPNLPNGSFGTELYPLVNSNKLNGVQFMTSTVGAKDVMISYYLRETGTSSEFTRLQYTTNAGGDWTDFPTSTSFPAATAGADLYASAPFTYDLSGFPGVGNNPGFGIQIVTEYQSTATYGLGSQPGFTNYITNGYVGADNLYSSGSTATTSAGTLTFDLVTIAGSPLDEAVYSPPTISPITNSNVISGFNTVTGNSVANGQSNYDFVSITNTFTIGSAITPVSQLSVSAITMVPNNISGSFQFSTSGSNITMVFTPNSIQTPLAASPVLVSVTDTTTGDVTWESYLLTLQSLNLPPTNTLINLTGTNMLANSTLNIPFHTGSYDNTNTSPPVSYATNSFNNTVIPTADLALSGEATPTVASTNLVFSITPAHNQLGQGVVSVTVSDGNPLEPKSTTATFPVMVRPNTNIVLIDYFNYDNSGPLETASAGYWGHFTGNEDQILVGTGSLPNTVTLDSLDNTESLEASLLGAPYTTNAGKFLYTSYIIAATDSTKLPVAGGSFVTALNDGTGNTGSARQECGVWVQTNGAAPGHYVLGISDFPTQEGAGPSFPQSLAVGTSYVVVTALNLSNGFSTLWVDPVNSSSPSVQDTTTAAAAGGTNLNIGAFTLWEGGTGHLGGSFVISTLKVGTTFDSVFPSLHIQASGTNNVILTWSDPTLGLQYSPDLITPWVDITNATSPYTNAIGGTTEGYFKFGQ